MKLTVLFIFLLTALSCVDRERFMGTWYLTYDQDLGGDVPKVIRITEDSIFLKNHYFSQWDSYKYGFSNGKMLLDTTEVTIGRIKDRFYLGGVKYLGERDPSDSSDIFRFDPKIEVQLPKVKGFPYQYFDEYEADFFCYGKRADNGQYTFGYKGKHLELEDLASALGLEDQQINLPEFHFLCDKSTPMEAVEKLFLKLRQYDVEEISVMNELRLSMDEYDPLSYRFDRLIIELPPIFDEDILSEPTIYADGVFKPSPPEDYYDPDKKINYVLLRKNQLYMDQKAMDWQDIKPLLERVIIDEEYIFLLYDRTSDYQHYMELASKVEFLYDRVENDAIEKLLTEGLSEYDDAYWDRIDREIPQYVEFSYSIEHYQNVTKRNPKFFGNFTKPLDSLLP